MKNFFKKIIQKIKSIPHSSEPQTETKEENSRIGLHFSFRGVRIVKCVRREEELAVEFVEGKDFERKIFRSNKINDQLREELSNFEEINLKSNLGLNGSNIKEKYKFFPHVEEEEIEKMINGEIETSDFKSEGEIIDYAIMGETDKQVLVLITGVSKKKIYKILDFIKNFSFYPYYVEPSPTALKRILAFNDDINSDTNCLVVNDNEDNLSISIYKGNSLVLNRKISSIGGNAINKAISKKVNVSLEEAREIKKELDLEERGGSNQNSGVSTVVKDLLMRTVVELERSIQYFINENPDSDIHKIFITGPILVKNIDNYLAEKLNIEVELINPFKKLKVSSEKNLNDTTLSPYSFAIATGLALRDFV